MARAIIIRRGGDDTDPTEWVDAYTEAQSRVDLNVLRVLVEAFMTRK